MEEEASRLRAVEVKCIGFPPCVRKSLRPQVQLYPIPSKIKANMTVSGVSWHRYWLAIMTPTYAGCFAMDKS
jgi:hypothetical protein